MADASQTTHSAEQRARDVFAAYRKRWLHAGPGACLDYGVSDLAAAIEATQREERERCLKIVGQYGGADFREIEEAIRAGR